MDQRASNFREGHILRDLQGAVDAGPFGDSAEVSSTSSISEIEHPVSPDSGSRQASGRNVKSSFVSYRLRGDYPRPWISDPRLKKYRYSNYIIWVFIVLGLLVSAYINFAVTRKIKNHQYCLVLDEKFSTLDPNTWNHEVQVGGFGTGSFDWTTTDSKNTFVDSDGLHIVPTLTTDTTPITRDQIFNGYTLNLTAAGGDGSCTGTTNSQCSIASNGTTGDIIPPVRSARLNTKGKKTIKYGRVEVVAKLPKGDWLWPAIWMMPQDSTYGGWPLSGEIDIAESRGNGVDYDGGLGGRDTYLSTLHWGASEHTDAYYLANRGRQLRRTDFSKGYHTFSVEWSKDYLFTYLDSRLQQVLYWTFDSKKTMWDAGNFASQTENSTLLSNPWANGGYNAPFDQSFYLILNVAVGSRNGWFKDGVKGKPWTDGGQSASDFYKNIDTWYPTWPTDNSRGMTVKSVKMWQEGACT